MCLVGNLYETHGAGDVQEASDSLEEQLGVRQVPWAALSHFLAVSGAQCHDQSCWFVSEASEGGDVSMGWR